MQLIQFISTKTSLPVKGIENTIQLFNEDCTVPFISRYRKERTGNLDEVEIAKILELKKEYEDIQKRKITIVKSLQEQGVLSDVLQAQIETATDLNTLEDIYLPFKRKRRSNLTRS